MSDSLATESIIVRGARVHNLKNVAFEVAHNTLGRGFTVERRKAFFDLRRVH